MTIPRHAQSQKLKQPRAFSQELETWLKTSQDKTLAGLIEVFAEKSFAILFLLCLCIAALPLPTAGVTHVTEVIAMLLCLELVIGHKTVWLPATFLKRDVGKLVKGNGITRLIGAIKWFERWSRRRLGGMLAQTWLLSLIGLIVLVFTVFAFVAPPFSGLDTLPALGVVVISLSLILEDALYLLAGLLIGIAGIALELTAGAALFKGLTHFL